MTVYLIDGDVKEFLKMATFPGSSGSGSGTPGTDGNTVLYGTAAPTTEGVDGNFYIRTTTSFMYGPKGSVTPGVWPAGTSMIGTNGADGNAVLYGTAAPTTEGVNGNFYIRTTTSFLYGPKAGGTWPAGTSMIGTMPSNAVVVDAVTGLFETEAGASIAEAFVDTVVDLIALTGAAYDDQKMIAKNPGNNTANYFPAEFFRMNSNWYTLGKQLLYNEVPRFRVTWPADAWDGGALTLATAAADAQTKITGVAGHALTTANQITAGNTYIYVSGSTGAGTIDWPVGWIKITAITDVGNDFTVLQAYSASLRLPVIKTIAAASASKAELKRISIPPLSTIGGFEVFVSGKNSVASGEHRYGVSYGASGVALGSATVISESTTSTIDSPVLFRAGVSNSGGLTTTNITTGPVVDADGWGLSTAGTTYVTPNISNGAANTDIIITAESNNGVDITMELVSVQVVWWR